MIGSAVEESVAILDDGDWLPGEMVAGVGEEGEHEDGDPEHRLLAAGEGRDQARHLQHSHAGGELHEGVICNHCNNFTITGNTNRQEVD